MEYHFRYAQKRLKQTPYT